MDDRQAQLLNLFVWKPVGWQRKPDKHRCAFAVFKDGLFVMFRQCERPPTVDIEGYGFCKTHGKKVHAALSVEQ